MKLLQCYGCVCYVVQLCRDTCIKLLQFHGSSNVLMCLHISFNGSLCCCGTKIIAHAIAISNVHVAVQQI